MIPDIDFVVPWVDDSDPAWIKKKNDHLGITDAPGAAAARYRDWDTLRYWFRGVESFAPWVRRVHFITDDQFPEWLKKDHPKLNWVKHTDFIPEEYLPTFGCHAIEWNLHRIEGISENFVFFNDDIFLINKTVPEDFFVNGIPCDLPILGPLYPFGFFNRILFNNMELINEYFSLKGSVKADPMKWIKAQGVSGVLKLALYGRRDLIPNSVSPHLHMNFCKSTFETIWEKEYERIHRTCRSKVRTKEIITSYVVRDWQIFSGDFIPKKPIGKAFSTASLANSDEALKYLSRKKGKVICLNDTENEENFEQHKRLILGEFEKLLPNKSSFEV